jgi:hypothetical protein
MDVDFVSGGTSRGFAMDVDFVSGGTSRGFAMDVDFDEVRYHLIIIRRR